MIRAILSTFLRLLPTSWKRRAYRWWHGPLAFPSARSPEEKLLALLSPLATRDEGVAAAAGDPAPPAGAASSPASEGPPLRHARLIMVTAENNNKFYDLREESDGTFVASWGRVGATAQQARYPMSRWESKVREKISKGYRDQTALWSAPGPTNLGPGSIDDPEVRSLFEALVAASNASIRHQYLVRSDQVTPAQVEEAQRILDQLAAVAMVAGPPARFDALLLDLYAAIPRRMPQVRTRLLGDRVMDQIARARAAEILEEEQANLDVMRAEVEATQLTRTPSDGPRSWLEVLGLAVAEVSDPETVRAIEALMEGRESMLRRVFRVRSYRRDVRGEAFVAALPTPGTRVFWHGSRSENWLSILQSGLVLRPAGAVITGKMFGYGLYFADRFSKSLNYTSLRGSTWSGGTADRAWIALFAVHLGRPLIVRRHERWCLTMDEAALRMRGDFDSIHAVRGADLLNDEFIVYREEQAQLRYLMELGPK